MRLCENFCDEIPFDIVAIVVLWDHLHTIWTLPPGDDDYSTRWKKLKSKFTRRWLKAGGREMPLSASRKARGERGIWQRRFWEHTLLKEDDPEAHLDYIHYNPVKHGYVRRPWDWTFSSFRRYVGLGQYDEKLGVERTVSSQWAGLGVAGWISWIWRPSRILRSTECLEDRRRDVLQKTVRYARTQYSGNVCPWDNRFA